MLNRAAFLGGDPEYANFEETFTDDPSQALVHAVGADDFKTDRLEATVLRQLGVAADPKPVEVLAVMATGFIRMKGQLEWRPTPSTMATAFSVPFSDHPTQDDLVNLLFVLVQHGLARSCLLADVSTRDEDEVQFILQDLYQKAQGKHELFSSVEDLLSGTLSAQELEDRRVAFRFL